MNKMFNSFLLLLSILSTTTLNAYSYDSDILSIYSKLSPRFILMSSQKEKINEDIELCIVHDDLDENSANSLITKITNNYPQGIKGHSLKFISTNYSNEEQCKKSNLIFLFNSQDKNIINTVLFSRKHKILTISYDSKDLSLGVDVSLVLGRKVQPYINLESVKMKDIEFNNILLRVSKIYIASQKESK